MSDFTIKKATRTGVKPLVGMYGKSGSGKTMSALLLARGLVGPNGRIVLIDSESGRGSIFADLIPNGYSVIDLEAPFSPERYDAAIDEAEKQADCIVQDSLSHEWSGEGGVIDMQEDELYRMAKDDWDKREKCKMAAWIKPKLHHKKFIQRLLRCKCALICCLRGEEKTHMAKGKDGKNIVVTDEFSSPLFDQRFIFELLVNFETVNIDGKGGFVIPRKITHPDIAKLIPGRDEQIGIKHGEALARWCASPSSSNGAPASATKSFGVAQDRKALLSELRDMTGQIHGWFPDMSVEQWRELKPRLNQYLIDEAFISDTETLDGMGTDRLQQVIKKVKEKLHETTQR